MNQSKIAVTKVGAYAVLSLRESITYQNCAEVEAHLQEATGSNQNTIIIEFKETTYLDSMALEMLLRMQNALKEHGRQMKIVGLNAVCTDILIATRLINQFHVHPDVREAIKELS